VHALRLLYEVSGNSHKGKEIMPKEKEVPVSFCLGLYKTCITLSLFGGALSSMNVNAQFSSMIIVRFIIIERGKFYGFRND